MEDLIYCPICDIWEVEKHQHSPVEQEEVPQVLPTGLQNLLNT